VTVNTLVVSSGAGVGVGAGVVTITVGGVECGANRNAPTPMIAIMDITIIAAIPANLYISVCG